MNAMVCTECGVVVIGNFRDMWSHYLTKHPLEKLFVDEYGGQTEYELAKELAIREVLTGND